MIRADRLGRGSIVESQLVLRDLQELGVSVFTRDQGEVKLDSAMDELISAATLAVARHENEIRSEKMLGVYKRKRAAGERIGNRLPYGLVDENGRVKADGERGAAVKVAFKMRLSGNGYHKISQMLSAIAPPQQFLNGRELTIRWTLTRVGRLLTNRSYVGVIVSPADFALVQRVSAAFPAPERSGDSRRVYEWPLSGSLRCYCGRAMTGMACGSVGRKIRYYACRASWNHDVSNRLVRADSLEEQFTDLLRRLVLAPGVAEEYRRKASTGSPKALERGLTDATKLLLDIDRKRDVVWDLHVSGKVRSEDVQERLDALSAQREEIRERIAIIQEQLAIARSASKRDRDAEALLREAGDIYARTNERGRREIARKLALTLGGLCVNKAGKLVVKAVRDLAAQRKPKAG